MQFAEPFSFHPSLSPESIFFDVFWPKYPGFTPGM
jgi:hypothetical protein